MNLKSLGVASTFVNRVNTGIWQRWALMPAAARAQAVWNEMAECAKGCGFALPAFEVGDMPGNAAAYFNPGSWKVVIGKSMCPDGADRAVMTELLTTVFHETRHCEQFYATARYIASVARSPAFLKRQTEVNLSQFSGFLNGPSGSDVKHPRLQAIASEYIKRRTGMPEHICDLAIASPMKTTDELFKVAKDMYDSVYATGNARMLAQLTNHTTIHIKYNSGPFAGRDYGSAYQAYFSSAMPYELDAYESETLVANVITGNPAIFTAPVVRAVMPGGRRGSI
jgi:hypothetical protein